MKFGQLATHKPTLRLDSTRGTCTDVAHKHTTGLSQLQCIKVSKLRKSVEGGLKIEIFCVLFILYDVYLSKREEKSSQKEKNQYTLRNKHEIQKKAITCGTKVEFDQS